MSTYTMPDSLTGQVLSAAQAAPSLDNSQPWLILPFGNRFEVYTDPHRAAPAADPVGRQRVISTGAALFTLRLALRVRGMAVETRTFPDPSRPGYAAEVLVRPGAAGTAEERRLAAAIVSRRTWRAPYSPIPVPDWVLGRLADEAAREGAALVPVAGHAQRDQLAEFLVRALAEQLADPARAAEQLSWLRAGAGAEDGIPLANIAPATYPIPGLPLPDPLESNPFCATDSWRPVVRGLAYRDALPLLVTHGDDPVNWLRAGCAVQRVLLTATRHGLATGFLNQPLECEPVRAELTEAFAVTGHPQLLLRLGYPAGPRPPATARRRIQRHR